MTIMWEVDTIENGQISYGFDPFTMDNIVTSTTQQGFENNQIHTATISGKMDLLIF